ncbi:hypothetical protein ACS126_18000 [Sphingobacterium lactis]|uniref:hypothetical protein n=1 Tax=Sphingobacterium lactis TaxID=797291 RepID=UPI000B94302A|nr:hypothetical protein CHT99_10310 [Sphingobacterium cellulitidis]
MAKTYAKGWKGILSIWDDTASAYKPLVCLTSTSHAMNGNTQEKVNMCTQGKTITKLQSISETVDFEGEVVDTTAVGGGSVEASLADIKAIMRAQALSGEADDFRLERDFDGFLYFPAQFLSISDSYSASEEATFSGQLGIQGDVVEVDPHAAPGG